MLREDHAPERCRRYLLLAIPPWVFASCSPVYSVLKSMRSYPLYMTLIFPPKNPQKGAWTINRKTIPSLNEFALKGSREETRVLGIETGNHTHRMGTLSRIPNPMFITTNSRYGGRLRPFDLYTLHGQKIVSTDVTNTRKIGESWAPILGVEYTSREKSCCCCCCC